MKKENKCVIFDIDGVIADSSYSINKYLLNREKPNWKDYYKSLDTCILNKWCLKVINDYIKRGYEIILITSRSGVSREITEKWLGDNKVKYHHLYMRNKGDFRPSDIVKKEIYMDKVHGKYVVDFLYEDDINNIEMFECFGITCIPIACDVIYSDKKENGKTILDVSGK